MGGGRLGENASGRREAAQKWRGRWELAPLCPPPVYTCTNGSISCQQFSFFYLNLKRFLHQLIFWIFQSIGCDSPKILNRTKFRLTKFRWAELRKLTKTWWRDFLSTKSILTGNISKIALFPYFWNSKIRQFCLAKKICPTKVFSNSILSDLTDTVSLYQPTFNSGLFRVVRVLRVNITWRWEHLPGHIRVFHKT